MDIPFHTHTGIESPRIDPKNLLGFPIFIDIPTHKADEGTIVLVITSGDYYLYAMIDRIWRGTQLTL